MYVIFFIVVRVTAGFRGFCGVEGGSWSGVFVGLSLIIIRWCLSL